MKSVMEQIFPLTQKFNKNADLTPSFPLEGVGVHITGGTDWVRSVSSLPILLHLPSPCTTTQT